VKPNPDFISLGLLCGSSFFLLSARCAQDAKVANKKIRYKNKKYVVY
jgi:hypothetical protein